MFERILVPLDGSSLAEEALAHARTIATIYNAPLTLLHVMERDGSDAVGVDPVSWFLGRGKPEAYLRRLQERLEQTGLEAEVVLREGTPADTILRFAAAGQFDLIALRSHGSGSSLSWPEGSVAAKVISRSNSSILLVRGASAEATAPEDPVGVHYHRILLPLDGSSRAEYALPLADSLARHSRADVVLAHVVRRPELPGSRVTDQQLARRIAARNARAAGDYLQQLQARLDAPSSTRLVEADSVALALQQLSEQEGADLLLLTAHGHTCWRQQRYGSVASHSLLLSTISVLVVQDLDGAEIRMSPAEMAAEDEGEARMALFPSLTL